MRTMLAILAVAGLVNATFAGFIFEIDTDGADDAVLTHNPNFSYGGDTTTASQSITSSAFGTTGGDSIFGGDGVNGPDMYRHQYAPDAEPDNLLIQSGQDLGDGNVGTGLVGGGGGTYSVYATWPWTSSVSGGLTTYEVSTAGDSFTVQLDQNGRGNVWVYLGDVDYSAGDITVDQAAGSNTFVSMRAYGLLFEAVPEPGTALLLMLGGVVALRRRITS